MSLSLSPAERALRGRLGAFALHAKYDARETTAKARQTFLGRFEVEVDPAGELDPAERARRAEYARKGAHEPAGAGLGPCPARAHGGKGGSRMTAPRNAAPPEHHFRGQTAGLETGLANSTIPRLRRGVTLADWSVQAIRQELSRKRTGELRQQLDEFRNLPPVVRGEVWHYAVALGLECADRAMVLEACEPEGGDAA